MTTQTHSIEDLIAFHTPSLQTPATDAQPVEEPTYGDSDFPRGLIPVAGIRCGEHL